MPFHDHNVSSAVEAPEALALLARAGLRRTQGRVQLMSVLLAADRPLSHQELLERSGLSRVALYRALDSFHAAGIAHRVDTGDRLWRFAVCECRHSMHCHPHFTCRVCGEVECLSAISLPAPMLPLANYRVEEQEVYWRGVCGKCAGGTRTSTDEHGLARTNTDKHKHKQ